MLGKRTVPIQALILQQHVPEVRQLNTPIPQYCTSGKYHPVRGSGVYSLWRLLATVHLKYDNENSAHTPDSLMSPHMPYTSTSVHALERSRCPHFSVP